MNKTRYCLLVVAIFLALTLSALNVAPAFADESTPPEPAPTEEMTELSEPVETEAGAESTEDTPTVAEIIESLPEDTTLVVVDENGETLPLASEAAAEIIAIADPQWCPVGVVPGSATCSGVKDSFNGGDADFDLIAWLLANQAAIGKAGVIWIQAGYVGTVGVEGGPVVLDGDVFTTMDNFALTINGGWTGTGTTLNPNTPSTFNVPFNIINWTGAITINNIVIEGASGNQPNLFVQTSGNILVNNIDVQNNTTDYGASLNNTSGAGTVTVNDSTFNNNTGFSAKGLEIYSNNTVTLKNISAMGNTLNGLYIYNGSASTPKAVTLNGTNHFSYNGEDGLLIITKGAITLNNVTAMGNTGGSGAYLSNSYSSTVPSAVTIKGTNNFSDNGWDGLRVYTYGAITISNITANDNGTDPNRPVATYWDEYDYYDDDAYGKGVFLYNWSPAPKPVTLSGTNTFNGNASTGLFIDANGLVKLNNLTANDNQCDSNYDIDGYSCAGAFIRGGGVTLTGYGTFVGNAEQGLEVYDAYVPSLDTFVGAITLTNLYAEANGAGGVWAVNGGLTPYNVTITGTNVFVDNQDDGLFVWSHGVVTVSNVTATGNWGNGVYVDNTDASTPKAVLISGANIFNGNGWDGLSVKSKGAITTNNVTAMDNGGAGVRLDNCGWEWDEDTEWYDCLGVGYSPQPITMNGINNTSVNGADGLSLTSFGAIRFSNLTANYNGNLGAYILNSSGTAVVSVTQTGYATFLDNYGLSGFNIYSRGAVMLANVTASGNNTYGGAITNNFDPLKPANVTLSGTNIFNTNGRGGLRVYTFGAVVLNNVTANDNGWGGYWEWDEDLQDDVWVEFGPNHGVSIFAADGTLSRPVTLNGINTFNGNSGSGLFATSLGAIKVNNVRANYNTQNGANLENNFAPLISQPITITGYGIFNNNGLANSGLIIYSSGNVTLANITANDNGQFGTSIQAENNVTLTTFANVTLSGVNTFNGNGSTGLSVFVDGNITVSNITANGNTNIGTVLDNDLYANAGLTGIRTVTVSGVNMFNGNDYGLVIYSNGTVTLTRITANYNNDGIGDGTGLLVITDGAINLTCGSMYNNVDNGYALYAGVGKVITIKGVFTYGNGLGDTSSVPTVKTRTCPLL